MTITTLILLLATGKVAVAEDDCTSASPSNISSCCELVSLLPKQFFTFSRNLQNASSSGVYQLNKFCGNDCIQAEAIVTPAMEEEDG